MNIPIKDISRFNKYLIILRRLILKKPYILWRIFKNYFKILILRQSIVRKVEIGITFDCQCDCSKCSSDLMKNPEKQRLSLAEFKQFGKEILKLGAIQINLTGGEPLLAPDFFQVLKNLSPKKAIITINTNGIMLTENLIDKLDRAGVDIIKISLDSPIPAEHDKSRQYQGCFQRAEKALAYIQKKGNILGQISTVCIKENLNSNRIWNLVDMAKKYNALLGLTIPAASGRWIGEKDHLIGKSEKKVLSKLIKISHVIRDTDQAYRRSHCPAGSEEFYLTCFGDIIPCPLIQISFGNIRKKTLRDIWEKMCDFKPFKNKKCFGCLAGEDKDFINTYIRPLKNDQRLPVDIDNLLEKIQNTNLEKH